MNYNSEKFLVKIKIMKIEVGLNGKTQFTKAENGINLNVYHL